MPAFADIAPSLQTGDIILFDGPSLESKEIEAIEGYVEKSKVGFASHVTMVVRLPSYDFPLIWEASTVAIYTDLLTGKPAAGVHLLKADELIQYCGDREYSFAARHLQPALTSDHVATLQKFMPTVDGKPFTPNLVDMVLSFAAGRRYNLPNPTGSFFCAELVATTYIALGLLPASRVPNSYCPADFSAPNADQLALTTGYSLTADEVFTAK